jgi:hypothetical protein
MYEADTVETVGKLSCRDLVPRSLVSGVLIHLFLRVPAVVLHNGMTAETQSDAEKTFQLRTRPTCFGTLIHANG